MVPEDWGPFTIITIVAVILAGIGGIVSVATGDLRWDEFYTGIVAITSALGIGTGVGRGLTKLGKKEGQ